MSTIVTDTITGKSTATTITIGSTPVVSASANSMTIRGEGSNQTSIQQGLAKFWINFNGSGTIATRDSFNVSSNSDDGTGTYTTSINSDMADANYHITGSVGRAGLASATISNDGAPQNTAGTVQIICANSSNAAFDPPAVFTSGHGDLA
jgi:hypothetical protein